MEISPEGDVAMLNEEKIELSVAAAASVCAFGNEHFCFAAEKDTDEFFIISFTYADVLYKIKAFGEVGECDGIRTVSLNVSDRENVVASKQYINALSTLTASAFMGDRRESLVKILVFLDKNGDRICLESVYNSALAEKKLEKLMRKIHRKYYIEKKIAEESALTLRSLKFPYRSVREGQEEFIKRSYRAIKHGTRVLIEAPTGIGKTISALYSSVRAMGEGYCDKIFYLTAKGSTANEAFKACEKLFMSGAKVRCVQLSAKRRICPQSKIFDGECDSFNCPLMKGYYSRSEEAIYELISSRYGYSSETVCEIAQKYNICPYELSLDLSEMCGVVICDYNYVFDPAVRIRRYFDDNAPKRKYVFLIDEAHNLVSRAKEMFSSELRMTDVVNLFAELSEACREEGGEVLFGKIKNDINSFAKTLKKVSHLCDDSIIVDPKGVKRGFYISDAPFKGLYSASLELKKKLSDFCDDFKGTGIYESAEAFLKNFSQFVSQLEEERDGMRYYIEIEDKEIIFKCMCVDPSFSIGERLAFSHSAVFFSATVSPAEYYMQILSADKRPSLLTLDSPFPKENRFCAAYTGVSTRYEKRDNDRVARRMLSLIGAVVSGKKGNYILYFPSYGYMRDIYDRFTAKYPSVSTIVQKKDMSYSQRREFIEFFADDRCVLRVGFCVLGGSFSEGIDLPGDRLIGTVIFGVGLPGISNEQNIIKEYYDFKGCDGYDFAYTYPGFNNVLQAAGRVIRSENDKGIIIFADERYAEEKYKRMMPERYRGLRCYADLEDLAFDIKEFWRNG